MDFSLTEAQRDLGGLTRRILAGKLDPKSWEPHGSGGFDRALWTELARAGILDAALPSAAGGGGFGLLEQCSVLIELGRMVAPVPYLPSITMAASALAEFGAGKQLETLVPVLRGERVLTAAVPDAGDPAAFTAEPDGDGWRLTGAQTAVPAAVFADALLIAAGDAVFVVDRDAAEISAQEVVDRGDAGLVELDAVHVDASARLGGTGVAEWIRLRGTTGLCAYQLGTVERALEMTTEYAKERKQFDNVIASFQAVRQRLADAYTDVEAVRLTLWQAAWRLSEGLPADEEVATAKFWAAEAGHRVAHTAVHLHGGIGIDVDYPLHRYFVAAKRAEFTLGGATAQLRRLGDLISG
ncbi:acyl-CoA dehydrogenase family protein [Amycolatopsis sp. 195334CR]|uniref:acyl-CoA dehydrogenase family protein n=1 Tax=Amycolatopsis sp. 195334CR TaxID=2814588 RepID=UPI001A8E0E6E|nr:acyl-CoA dehydrogenase family protein [Amycolatopsis sp. 195334CR]MBN6041572.1 acyl-CoA/acyl-ACP dehydrogenase [Amycolatopsis sp. 195334CR]